LKALDLFHLWREDQLLDTIFSILLIYFLGTYLPEQHLNSWTLSFTNPPISKSFKIQASLLPFENHLLPLVLIARLFSFLLFENSDVGALN